METSPKPPRGGDSSAADAAEDRRGFLAQAVTLVLGGVGLLVPAVTGIVAFLNPLNPLRRQQGQDDEYTRLTTLEVLPEDGTPRRFPVIADRTDAWNHYPEEPIGAVFLRRTGDPKEPVRALHVVCPHLGCFIEYRDAPEGGKFFCPCHGASFDLNGKRLEEPSESPRDMDTLKVKIEKQTEVSVEFKNFRTGPSEKIEKT